MTDHDDLASLEATTGEEPPLPHDPPPPPGWEDPLEAIDVLDDPSASLEDGSRQE